ncbi:ATP-binding cassette domain-containing protein [Mycoplasma anatis]|uniref:ATP-binding cassette domain-containing protein n=1 Tax=Mycoplasmopsis anatis TaxID=171279 RepID=A0A9Q3L668_9BACT|nr:ABC transporter ATP-binding protein [Mycoplasmopsis anatis]MBW0596548.1 ATP-binding cassette domain-containing protein [Mycoplasmopsis anatis]MBW0602365.1 ATP-binding cassette domain-containing protein [Mycoplasmopsis anatis]MBW0603879.1 ATP-binding cassette domain-containing protein [Mycoplasmopsis anatis]
MMKIRNLTKKFNNQVVIDNLDLEFENNKLIFIVGRSGCGKSTLLNLIAGLEKPDSGEISINDDSNNINNHNNDQKIDFIFQDFNLIENLSGLQNIIISNQIINRNISKLDIYDIASKINISKQTLNKKVSKLSGGEKQRVAILRSITRESDIILCDEPTGNLDAKNSDEIFSLLSNLKKSKTIIVVSHDLEAAKKYGDYIFDLESKTLIQNNIDCIEEKNISNIKSKKNSFTKFKPILSLTWSDFKKKWFLFLLVIFTFVTTCISTSTTINLTQHSFNINKSYKNQIEQNIYEIKGYKNSNFLTSWDLNNLKKYGFDHISEEYINRVPYFYINNDWEVFNNVFFTDNSKYMMENIWINSNTKIPFLNDNDIVLGKDIVEKLNINNPVGKKIEIYVSDNDKEIKYDFNIVGVNENITINDTYYTYFSKNMSLEWAWDIAGIFDKEIYFISKSAQDEHLSNLISPTSYKVISHQDNVKILEGKDISNFNEILIPSSSEYANSKYLNEYFTIGGWRNNFLVKAVGIYESESNEILVSSDLYNIGKENLYKSINVYTDDKGKIENLENTSYYSVTNYTDQAISKIVNSQSSTSIILAYISFGLGLLSLIFITIFSFMSIHSKRKEIGILKVYGAKPLQSLMYHLCTIVLMLLLTLLFSFASVQLLQNSLYSSMENFSKITPIISEIYLKMFILWLIIFAFTIIIYTSISITTFFKKSLNLLRTKN